MPRKKEDFSLPEPTDKIQGKVTNKPNLGHGATTEPVTVVAQGTWDPLIGQAQVTWHPLVPPLEPDVVKEEQLPIFHGKMELAAEQVEGAEERCLLNQKE